MHTVFSVGYTGFPYEDLLRQVRDRRLLLVDVRLKPVSRWHPRWAKASLADALGDSYAWVPELGNLNYKGGPVALQDVNAGLTKVRTWLEDRDVALLCTCPDPATCHRTTVTDLLKREGYPIEPLIPTKPAARRVPAKTATTSLF